MALARWWVEITYRTDKGPCIVEYDMEELEELHNIVERGPNWNSILDIRVKYNRTTGPVTLTAEQGRML